MQEKQAHVDSPREDAALGGPAQHPAPPQIELRITQQEQPANLIARKHTLDCFLQHSELGLLGAVVACPVQPSCPREDEVRG